MENRSTDQSIEMYTIIVFHKFIHLSVYWFVLIACSAGEKCFSFWYPELEAVCSDRGSLR